MTLVNATVTAEAIYVLTDGAITEVNGATEFTAQKILPITHLSACVCIRGNALLLGSVWQVIWMRRKTFAEAAEFLGVDYKACVDALRPMVSTADASGEAYLIGWDNDAGTPEVWIAANYDRPGCPAFQPQRTQGVTMGVSGCSERIMALATAAQTPFDTSGVFDPRRDGPELIAAQAAQPDSMSDSLCHLTTIYPHRIEMEILERWSDGI
jgi:hypothetical protein